MGLLLSYKANFLAKNKANQTPLFFARPDIARSFGLAHNATFFGNPQDLAKQLATQAKQKLGGRSGRSKL